MSQPGIGAMLHYLGGGSEESSSKYYGRTIKDAGLENNQYRIDFDDGITIKIIDDGQSCCESRYITSDDEPAKIIGGKLLKIEVKDGPSVDDEYDCHDTCFIEIQTDKGFVTLTTHADNNSPPSGTSS